MDPKPLPLRSSFDRNFYLFLAWALACVGVYLWKIPAHPLRTLEELSLSFRSNYTLDHPAWPLLMDHLRVLTLMFAFLVTALGTGERLLSLFAKGDRNRAENWAWSLGMGWLFWGTLAEGAALENVLYPALLKTLSVAGLAGVLLLDRRKAFTRCWPMSGKTGLPVLWKVAAALTALLSLANLLAPEMSWDAMTYQLILPKFYLLNHGIYPVTGILPSHSPSLGQMFFTWGEVWGDDSLARSFSFFAHVGTALALAGIGSRLESPALGWTAAAFYWIFPYLNIYSTRGYVDLITGFFAVLGLGALIVASAAEGPKGDPGMTHRVGLCLGALALGAVWGMKYDAFFYSAAAAVILGSGSIGPKPGRVFWLFFGLSPLFFIFPWALKSWEYTHDPLFPYFTRFFPAFDWTAYDEKASAIKFHFEGIGGLLRTPRVLWGIFFGNYSGAPNEEVSLVPLAAFPLMWLGLRGAPWKKAMMASIAVPFIFWMVTSHQFRLIQPVVAFTALFAAFGFHRALGRWEGKRAALSWVFGSLLLLCAYFLFQGLVAQPNPFPFFAGVQDRDQFLGGILRPKGYVEASNEMNEKLPPDAKVLILGQQNGYYLDRVSAYDFDYTTPVLRSLTEGSDSPEGIFRRFKEKGFTHILYNSGGMMGTAVRTRTLGVERYPWKPAELSRYERFFLRYTRKVPLGVGEGYSIYEVGPREGSSCLPEYLPGTEDYYLTAIQADLGLARVSDIVGRNIPASSYLAAYRKLSETHPEIGYPCFQYALSTMSMGTDHLGEAMERGKWGWQRSGDDAGWLALEGDAAFLRKDFRKAVGYLEQAEKLSPDREDVARNLAAAYYNEHDLEKASREADRAAALVPTSTEYREFAVQLHAALIGSNRHR